MKPFWILDASGNLVNIGHFAAVEKQPSKALKDRFDILGVLPSGERFAFMVGQTAKIAAQAMSYFAENVCVQIDLTVNA